MKISCFKWGFTKTEKPKLWFSLSYVITFFKKYLPIIAYFKLIQCFFQDWRGFLRIVGSAGFSVLIVFEQSLCNSSQQRGIHFLAWTRTSCHLKEKIVKINRTITFMTWLKKRIIPGVTVGLSRSRSSYSFKVSRIQLLLRRGICKIRIVNIS